MPIKMDIFQYLLRSNSLLKNFMTIHKRIRILIFVKNDKFEFHFHKSALCLLNLPNENKWNEVHKQIYI